jgi:hypothetical protein
MGFNEFEQEDPGRCRELPCAGRSLLLNRLSGRRNTTLRDALRNTEFSFPIVSVHGEFFCGDFGRMAGSRPILPEPLIFAASGADSSTQHST